MLVMPRCMFPRARAVQGMVFSSMIDMFVMIHGCSLRQSIKSMLVKSIRAM